MDKLAEWIGFDKDLITIVAASVAVGLFFDGWLLKTEKEALKKRLEDWWLRFNYIQWSNFGQTEAKLAIGYLDRWAGPKLLSWKRWTFSIAVTLVVAALTLPWIGVVGTDPDIQRAYLFEVLLAIPLFALSMTLTRLLAHFVSRHAVNRKTNIILFATLIIIHLIMFFFWTGFVYALKVVIFSILEDPEIVSDFDFSIVILPFELWYENVLVLARTDAWSSGLFDLAMSFIANGLRIGFAAAFLSSFLFRPVIQPPISWLWYRMIYAKSGIVTVVFGTIGVLIWLIQR